MLLQRILADSTRTFATIGLGATLGQYVQTCGEVRRYEMASVSVGVRQETGFNKLGARLQVFGGSDRPADRTSPGSMPPRFDIAGGALRIAADNEFVGVELGIAAGRLVLDGERPDPSPQAFIGGAHPIVGLRLGFPEYFAFASYGANDVAFTPRDVINLGVGFGVDSSRSAIRVGVGDAGGFVKAKLALRNGVTLTPGLTVGDRAAVGLGVERAFRIR